jgi:hypothetical protein
MVIDEAATNVLQRSNFAVRALMADDSESGTIGMVRGLVWPVACWRRPRPRWQLFGARFCDFSGGLAMVDVEDFDMPWGRLYRVGLLEPPEVHQAVGMLIAQLGVDAEDALARLRGRAAVVDQPVVDVARAVISRRLRFVVD